MTRSNAGMQTVSAASSSTSRATNSVVGGATQNSFLFAASAGTASARSDMAPGPRRASNAGQRVIRLKTGGPPLAPVVAPVVAPVMAPLLAPAQPSPPEPVHRRAHHHRPRHPVETAEPAPPPAPAPAKSKPLEKFTRSIQSLDNYDLIRFIPVTIEPLGESVFVAVSTDLDLSVTGRTADEAVDLLKEMIIRIYEGSRSRKNTLDAARARQLKTLESFIGKSKGMWHWA
jgi:hypothetical protein